MACQFHRPSSIAEAVRLRGELGSGAFFLAGGTLLNSPAGAGGATHLVSLAGLGLEGIADRGAEVAIGACTTLQQLLDSDGTPAPLRAAAKLVGNRNIRNAATLGGHLGANAPTGDLLPTLVVSGARLLTATAAGTREVPVLEWISTGPSGLLTQVLLPKPPAGRHLALSNHVRTANDRSVMSVAVALTRGGELVRDPVVAVGGVAPHVIRLERVEAFLAGRALPRPEELEAVVGEHVRPEASLHGSPAFKKHLAGVLVARAVAAAWEGR
ncbi:MAG: FAD binding domain-containing protein [Myxococcaceae bacterium]